MSFLQLPLMSAEFTLQVRVVAHQCLCYLSNLFVYGNCLVILRHILLELIAQHFVLFAHLCQRVFKLNDLIAQFLLTRQFIFLNQHCCDRDRFIFKRNKKPAGHRSYEPTSICSICLRWLVLVPCKRFLISSSWYFSCWFSLKMTLNLDCNTLYSALLVIRSSGRFLNWNIQQVLE